ncbi:hypothetical protein IGJ02_000492 [Enterococcus sp. DIV0724b]|uniref:YccF domain-containing protein n=1 Tax=Enterococcus sp. DIV0724b TaxID=2774694 RepID=UPI003D3009BC
MTILGWIFIGCFSAFFITFFIGAFSFIIFFLRVKDANRLKKRRPKEKQKRKRWMHAKRVLEKKKKMLLKRGIILISLSILFAISGLYTRHYEMTNLSNTDSSVIAQSYFITDEVNKNLLSLQNGKSGEDVKAKLMELSSLLASYGSTLPSNNLTTEGQHALTRYYVQLRDYGTNLYSLSIKQLNDPKTVQSYVDELARIKQTQKKLFKQFSVNEEALKQKK